MICQYVSKYISLIDSANVLEFRVFLLQTYNLIKSRYSIPPSILRKILDSIPFPSAYTRNETQTEHEEFAFGNLLHDRITNKKFCKKLNIRYFSIRLVVLTLFEGTIYPTPPLGQDMTQGQFLSGI